MNEQIRMDKYEWTTTVSFTAIIYRPQYAFYHLSFLLRINKKMCNAKRRKTFSLGIFIFYLNTK